MNLRYSLITILLLASAPTAAEAPLSARLTVLAEKGDAAAAYHLGMLYQTGSGVPHDPKRAFTWFTKAASAGDALGAYKVGCFYAGQGAGVVANDAGLAFRHKMVAAKAGYSLAQYDVGAHLAGQQQFAEALRWFKLAAAQGYPMAMLAVATLASRPDVADPVSAFTSFKLATQKPDGTTLPAAKERLAELSKSLTPAQRTEAEALVQRYRPAPTALTRTAMSGIEAAENLVSKR